MVQIIHARERPEGLRFRLWSTIVDSYLCEPMERDAFAEWLRGRSGDASAERLTRAERAGTSSLVPGDVPESLTEWDTEVCQRCGGFHHAYEKRGGMSAEGLCSRCGEPRADKAHRKSCTKPPATIG